MSPSLILLCFLAASGGSFQPAQFSPSRRQRRGANAGQYSPLNLPPSNWNSLLWSTQEAGEREEVEVALRYESIEALNDAVASLCRNNKLDEALELIHSVEDDSTIHYTIKPHQSTYAVVLNALARSDQQDKATRAENIFNNMPSSCPPKGQAYSAVILAWSNSKHPDAPKRANELLEKLWSLYKTTKDKAYLPTRATYTSVISAWARSHDKAAAERAEELLEEMEAYYRQGYTLLGPTTACVNAVL